MIRHNSLSTQLKSIFGLERGNIYMEMNKDEKHGISLSSNSSSKKAVYSSDDLLGTQHRDYLLSPPTANQVKICELKRKVTGIYFSANWYPPCRSFNDLLIQTYNQIKNNNCNFEIVFVSSDEDQNAFNGYYSTMPWLAVPFSDLETKRYLNKRFEVESIPSLIILQPNENQEILHEGVEYIHRHGALAFPFTKARLQELEKEEKEKHESQTLITLLTNGDRDFVLAHPKPQKVKVEALVGKTIGLYFSAQWCHPALDFTPRLVSIYHKIKSMLLTTNSQTVNQDFETIFISSDTNQSEFDAYFGDMPWLALPFGDPVIKDITKYLDIREIPSLVILDPDGKTVTRYGRNLVNLYKENAYPFTRERVEILEKEMDEEAKCLPVSEMHSGHRHELTLVSQDSGGGGPFICCDCDEQGSRWAYQCIECGYEVHPKCVRALVSQPTLAL